MLSTINNIKNTQKEEIKLYEIRVLKYSVHYCLVWIIFISNSEKRRHLLTTFIQIALDSTAYSTAYSDMLNSAYLVSMYSM